MRSDLMKKGISRIPHRALFKSMGYTQQEIDRPIIGIVNAANEIIPGHIHLNTIAQAVKDGVRIAGGTPVAFGAIGVCDGIAMNHRGMSFSLPSREHIADSVEIMASAHPFDGLVFISSCDKIIPGMLMAALRLNIPAIFISGGPMLPGKVNGEKVALTDAFEAVGGVQTNVISQERANLIEENSCPGCGSCAGMFTANSMNCLTEVLGFSLPGNGTIPAVMASRLRLAKNTGMKIMELVEKDIKPRDIITKESITNGITMDMALGCSTNTALHIPAIAHEANIQITLDDFDEISDKTPQIVKLNPASKIHFVEDLDRAGGLSALFKELDDMKLLDTSNITVTGRTMAENIEHSKVLDDDVIRNNETAYSKTGGLVVLKGNIAPNGSIVKKGAVLPEMMVHTGPAKCFNSEEECCKALQDGKVVSGDVVVVRYEGPKGGPGMREMLSPTSVLAGMGLDRTVALITDGRFSGVSKGASIGHISPEAASGGLIAYIKDGDLIEIDIPAKKINLKVDQNEIAKRQSQGVSAPERDVNGYLARYRKYVSSADRGAIILD